MKVIFEKEGFFDCSEYFKQQKGTVKIFENGKVELQILNKINPKAPRFKFSNKKIEIISGILENGKKIFLQESFYIGSGGVIFSGYSRINFICNKCYVYNNFKYNEIINFTSIIFEIDNLEEWINQPNADVTFSSDNNNIIINYQRPKQIKYDINNEFDIIFLYSYECTAPHHKLNQLKQIISIKISTKEEQPLNFFIKNIYKLVTFFSICQNALISFRNMKGYNRNIVKENSYPINNISVDIFYQNYFDKKTDYLYYKSLVAFSTIQKDFSKIFTLWCEKFDELSPVVTFYNNGKFFFKNDHESRFLMYAIGLEVLHNRTTETTSLNKKKYQNKLQNLLEESNIEEKYKKKIRDCAMGGYQLSFAERLKCLCHSFEFVQNEDKMIKNIRDIRNHLVHRNESNDKLIYNNFEEILNLTNKMDYLLILNILSIVEVDYNKINAQIKYSIENFFKQPSLKLK